ncbi:phosphatidylserine decarboxylase 1 [Martiniozyma asiatica (nom. inval.)]|nr:phosphatidylserine decarboxylase 1 [Martiniozyma asiatica]
MARVMPLSHVRLNSTSNGKIKQKRQIFKNTLLISIGMLTTYSIFVEKNEESLAEDVRPTSLPLYIYSYLPLNALSRLWGQFNSFTLPIYLREPGYRLYSTLFGVNLDEMKDSNLSNYPNLGEFFYRQIKPECRPIDPIALVNSPSDGRILSFGKVKGDEVEQVKGMTYKLNALLGTDNNNDDQSEIVHAIGDDSIFDESFHHHFHTNTSKEITTRSATSSGIAKTEKINIGDQSLHPTTASIYKAAAASNSIAESTNTDLFYAVIYLAPGDYHRFHSPVTWVTTHRRHFTGQLYSVAPYFQRTFQNLFVLNERVALLGYWKYGFFSMTPVGATNVGSIKLNFDKDLNTNVRNKKRNQCIEASYANASSLLSGRPLLKGEEMGGFKLGSTVVLVFEAPKNFEFTVKNGDKVKMGQSLGEII